MSSNHISRDAQVRSLASLAFLVVAGYVATASGQFGQVQDPQLKTNFEFQPQTMFEPRLQTNFEPHLPTTFGFQATRSATNARLQDRLLQLQPRLPEEKKFLADVVQLVEQGHLPEAVVNEAFFYSIKRYGGPAPFPYFERILRLQGERVKAQVPSFDRTVYSKERFNPQLFNQ